MFYRVHDERITYSMYVVKVYIRITYRHIEKSPLCKIPHDKIHGKFLFCRFVFVNISREEMYQMYKNLSEIKVWRKKLFCFSSVSLMPPLSHLVPHSFYSMTCILKHILSRRCLHQCCFIALLICIALLHNMSFEPSSMSL